MRTVTIAFELEGYVFKKDLFYIDLHPIITLESIGSPELRAALSVAIMIEPELKVLTNVYDPKLPGWFRRLDNLVDVDDLPSTKSLWEKYNPADSDTGYMVGDRFLYGGETYILAQTDEESVCLISLKNGNRFRNPSFVDNTKNLTFSEWESICRTPYKFAGPI